MMNFLHPLKSNSVLTTQGWCGFPDLKSKCICSSGKSVPINNETSPGFNGGLFLSFKCLFDNFKF